MSEFLTLIMNHWEWVVMFFGGLPLIFKSIRTWLWGKCKHICRIWSSPNRIDAIEDRVVKKIDDLAKENVKEHEEVNARIDKLEDVVRENHKELVGHLMDIARDKGGDK